MRGRTGPESSRDSFIRHTDNNRLAVIKISEGGEFPWASKVLEVYEEELEALRNAPTTSTYEELLKVHTDFKNRRNSLIGDE